MASGEYDIRPATTLPAPPASGEAHPGAWLPPSPQNDEEIAAPRPSALPSVAKVWLLRLWRGRGLIGGLVAIWIAWLGQSALISQNDFVTSTRDYLIAIAIVILSLLHPERLSIFKRKQTALVERESTRESVLAPSSEAAPVTTPVAEPLPVHPTADASIASTAALAPIDETGVQGLPVRPLRSSRSEQTTVSHVNGNGYADGNGHANGALPAGEPAVIIRPARHDHTERNTVTDAAPVATPVLRTNQKPWTRYTALRARLGWKVTAPGLALSVALAVASLLVLNGNAASPLGGWLWAGSLAVLVLTFLGADGWPRGEGLLPGPWSDWFAPGVPRIPWKVEVVLVVLLMGLATFLRVYNLEWLPGIFGDEGERGMDARAIFNGQPDNIFSYGWWGVPNIYFYLLTVSFHIFGDNLTGDRMLSAISGIVAVWYIYKIGRLLWGPRAGLIAGAMMAVSPLALQFSRLAGESTPTGALWAVGAYYLLLALRHRRWSDWVLSGFFWSFNLYFYASGKMVIPLAGVVAIYALIRWRGEFFKRYFLGFALMGLAFIVTFMPYGVTSAKDNWQGFMGRANETSIFSPQNQAGVFARYGLAYDPSWASKSAFENFRTDPVAWGGLLYQQSREVLDGVYRRGDQVPFYNVPGIVALAPFWAVLGLLGLAYAAWKFWDPRYAIAMMWFVVGMGATILTIDAPNYQRYTNAWPAMMLFPAALLDRIFAAGWPISLNLARRWSAVPLTAVLIFFGVDSYREYFVFYPTTCPYCTATVQARYAQALGQDYKAYQMGVGGYDNYFGYGSTRFVAENVEGVDMVAAADDLPVTDNNGKGLAFIIYPNNVDYLPLLHVFYPMGLQEDEKGVDGSLQFTSFKVTRQQVASTRQSHAIYKPANGSTVEQGEAGIGTSPDRPLPKGLAFPVSAEWRTGLVAPQYGTYTFSVAGGASDTNLSLDGRSILQGTPPGSAPLTVQMVLAKGIHDIDLKGTLTNAQSGEQLLWAAAGGTPQPIESRYLFNGPTGGLSGEIGPLAGSGQQVLVATDPFGSQPLTQRRSDPFIGFREASVIFNNTSYLARWRGKLNVPTEGDYSFTFGANAQTLVMIDGQSVFGTGPNGPASGGPIHLTAGPHDIEARYVSQAGPTRIELFWTPPGGQPAIIPPTYLTPLQRSWTPQEMPGAPAGNVPAPTPAAPTVVQPDLLFGSGDLSSPRGIAVAKDGTTFVGDRGNHRIVAYTPDGKVARTWGQAAPQSQAGQTAPAFKPGDFADILDVSVDSDNTVYVFDSSGRLQAFSEQGDFKGSFDPSQLSLYAPNGIGSEVAAAGKAGPGVYIAVTGQNRIVRTPSIDSVDGGQTTLAQGLVGIQAGGSAGDQFDQPVDVAADPTGSGLLYAIDLKNRIMRLRPPTSPDQPWTIDNQWQVQVGTNDGGSRLAVSPDGTEVYMTDPNQHRVDILDVATGKLSYLGTAGADPGKFEGPSGIAVGQDGRLFVVDSINHNVQVFDPTKIK